MRSEPLKTFTKRIKRSGGHGSLRFGAESRRTRRLDRRPDGQRKLTDSEERFGLVEAWPATYYSVRSGASDLATALLLPLALPLSLSERFPDEA
jgi:hypothetical protein